MEKPKFDIESVPEPLRPYFEAMENGTLPQYYLDRLRHKRDDYLDDLPDVDVRRLATLDDKGHFVGDNYKCRSNYISGLAGTLSAAIDDGVITDSELVEKIQSFRQHDFRHSHGEFTTPQEIDMINQILADVIQYLEESTLVA